MAGGLWPIPASPSQTRVNAKEAQKQRDWSERMSASSHQRSAADLMAAGLNPLLAATQGPGGVPGGAAASVSAGAGMFDPASIYSAKRARAEIENIQWDTLKKREETGLTSALDTSAKLHFNMQRRLFDSAEHRGVAENESAAAHARTQTAIDSSAYGKGMQWINRALPAANSAAAFARGQGLILNPRSE